MGTPWGPMGGGRGNGDLWGPRGDPRRTPQGPMGTPCGPMETPWGPWGGGHGDPWGPHGDPRRGHGGPWGPMGAMGGWRAAGRVHSLLSPYGPLCYIIGGTDVNALGSAIADAMDNFNNSCNSTAQTKIWIPSFAQIAVAKGNLMTHESASLHESSMCFHIRWLTYSYSRKQCVIILGHYMI